MLHVCCIRAGERFSPAYVVHLKDMVARNLDAGFPGRFVCFTDRPQELPETIETAPLPAELPGWWSKLALFRKGLFPDGDRIVFFDLDTLITGPIDRLMTYDGDFGILADFYRPQGLQSSVMAWRASLHSEIWESFEAAGCPMEDPGGDQAWIEHCQIKNRDRLQVAFPDMFVSYKKSSGLLPDKASVVIFHGLPRPHEVTEGWVPKVWREGGISHAQLKAVVNTAHAALVANVRTARARRDLKWFDADNEEHDRHVAIIGGGPSVLDKIHEIQWRKSQDQKIWVLNNARKALPADLAIDMQVLLDARPENAGFVTDACEYLVASQCAPEVFDALKGKSVTLWHANSPWMPELLKDEKDRVTYLIGGGTTVGMNALALAVSLGYRKIHLYGFDSCYRDGAHHAYAQTLNDGERASETLYQNKTYFCAPWMVGQAQEFMDLAAGYEADGVTITVHGSGLLPDIAKDLNRFFTPAEARAQQIIDRVPMHAVGAEIGVFAGEISRALLKSDKVLSLYMVDSWEGSGEAYQGDSGDWHAQLTDQMQEGFLRQAKQRVKFAGPRAHVIRERSVDAADQVADGSLDFVFIDADHSYEGCKADIEAWRPKIKPGGLLSGHDYQNPNFPLFGVTRAVDEFVSRHALKLETGDNFCWFVQLPTEGVHAPQRPCCEPEKMP
jgi:hypothetical protein